jgi:hypothetical protein
MSIALKLIGLALVAYYDWHIALGLYIYMMGEHYDD